MSDDRKSTRSNTFEFGATLEQVQDTLARRAALPDNLDRPLRSLVTQLSALVERGPVAVYLTSDDADRDLRNHFTFLLATYLRDRESTTVIVDCDYAAVGLSGLVPQKDALGFLDLLLYGSSLGAITQEGPNHLRVIGAGSFAVGKKSPFVMDAFRDAHRYLVSHSRCLLYVGPGVDDAEEMHPLAEQLDLVIALGKGVRRRTHSTPVDNKLSALAAGRVWHVRIVDPPRPATTEQEAGFEPVPREPPVVPAKPAPARTPLDSPVGEDTEELEKPAAVERPDEDTGEFVKPDEVPRPTSKVRDPSPRRHPSSASSSPNSALPKVVMFVVAFLLVAFVVWWLYQTKTFRDGTQPVITRQPPATEDIAGDAAGSTGEDGRPLGDAGEGERVVDEAMTTTGVADTLADATPLDASATRSAAGESESETARQQPDTAAQQQPVEVVEDPVQPVQEVTRPVAEPEPNELAMEPGVTVAKGLKGYTGSYLIHISSYRELESARVDADALAEAGYAVVIAYVDTGSRGFYHRVYVGPFKYRDNARVIKIKLDEIPFVTFTRITKAPG